MSLQNQIQPELLLLTFADGIAVVPPGACFSRRLFVQVLLHFRYAAEAEEFTKYSFKKTVVLHSEELHPKEELPDGENLNKWQVRTKNPFVPSYIKSLKLIIGI